MSPSVQDNPAPCSSTAAPAPGSSVAELQLCQPTEVTPNSRHIASGQDRCGGFGNDQLGQLFNSRTHTHPLRLRQMELG